MAVQPSLSSGHPDGQDTETALELIIVIDQHGAQLPQAGGGALPLGLAELHWLAAQVGAEPEDTGNIPAPTEESKSRIQGEINAPGGFTERLVPLRSASPINASATASTEAKYRLQTPVALALTSSGFLSVDHDGVVRARFGSRELASALSFTTARDLEDASSDQATRLGEAALAPAEFERLFESLVAAGVLVHMDQDGGLRSEGRVLREFRRGMALQQRRSKEVEKFLSRRSAEEAEREQRTGRVRTKVVPVNSEGNPLLSLGLSMAHAAAVDGGRLAESYEFVSDWCDRTVPSLSGDEPPAIYLFSNYIWSHAWNVVRSAEVKAKSPNSITVHGGPNVPKYAEDIDAFFLTNPHVDVAVHGEGEATFAELLDALQGHVGEGPPELSVLRDIPGLTFRDGEAVVHTGKRERIAELDIIPSPYQVGLFDSVGDVEITLMTFESNRGCPYGCTFCDWGSATQSRIRKFDLDRVFHELEWCAQHKVKTIFCADANFGIFERDVDIARKIVQLKQDYGYPTVFESSYAKNTVKHLREIIETLVAGGILSTGTLSLQSVDSGTLDAIRRSNIKVEKYDELAVEFGKQGLPLVIELMMGLPGSTMQSFLGDLQQTIDREVKARVNPTEVLMNSPMNDPEYRREHQVQTLRPVNHDWTTENGVRKKALVISTSSFTRDEYDRMERYRRVFLLCENYAVLRQVSRFVRQEARIPEMEFYVRLTDDAAANPSRWPTIAFTFKSMLEYMLPPVSWRYFIDEVREYLISELGIDDTSALDCVLTVQHALLPAREREFPCQLTLEHDYAAWHREVLDIKRRGYTVDWPKEARRLESFGPAVFEVDDPQSIAVLGFGMSLLYDTDSDWELSSPVARPMRYRHAIIS